MIINYNYDRQMCQFLNIFSIFPSNFFWLLSVKILIHLLINRLVSPLLRRLFFFSRLAFSFRRFNLVLFVLLIILVL